jgi:hypothetical protein
MGHKSREKKLRRAQKPTNPSPAQIMFEDVPHEKEGEFLVPQNKSSPSEMESARENRRQRAPLIGGLIKEKVDELQALLSSISIIDMLVALSLEVFAVDLEHFKFRLSGRSPIYAEYPTWLHLTSVPLAHNSAILTREQADTAIHLLDELMSLVD